MKSYSYSKLAKFLECPGALKMSMDRVPEMLPEVVEVGSLFHCAANLYTRHCVKTHRYSDITTVQSFMQLAFSIVADIAAKEGRSAPAFELVEETESILQAWAERTIIEPSLSIQTESQYAITEEGFITEWDNEDAWFRAIFDRIEFHQDNPTHLTVWDYKAGWKIEADPLQFDVYAWMLMLSDPMIERVTCNFEFVRYGVVKTSEYDSSMLDSLNRKIRGLIDQIEATEDFPFRPGRHCMACSRAHACQAKPQIVDAITDIIEAEKAVETIALLERDMKLVKARLREYTDIYGPVTHNGTCWGTHASESEGFRDATKFIEACKGIGEDPAPFLSVNNVKAKRLRKLLPNVLSVKRTAKFCGKGTNEEGGDE
jgi:hypothetical protein